MTAPEVISAWSELTGETWKPNLRPYIVQSQASEFERGGFSREDMELVVRWTRAQIKAGRNGFNAQSLTWRVMAADQWAKLQERLAAARAWHARTAVNGLSKPSAPKLGTNEQGATRADPAAFAATGKALGELKRAISGGNL